MSAATGNAAERAPLPLSVALGFEDAGFLDRLTRVAAVSDGPLGRDLEEAVSEAVSFRNCLIGALARDDRGHRRAGDL